MEMVYQYDGQNERTLKQTLDADGYSDRTLYLRGLSDYPLAELDNNGAAEIHMYGLTGLETIITPDGCYYPIKDHLGSIRAIVNTAGSVGANYEYNAFGELIASEVSVDARYRYTGLFNYRARWYDPTLKRFMAVDPMLGVGSPYAYCGNNPVLFVDPTGMTSIRVVVDPDGVPDSGDEIVQWVSSEEMVKIACDLCIDTFTDLGFYGFSMVLNFSSQPELDIIGIAENIITAQTLIYLATDRYTAHQIGRSLGHRTEVSYKNLQEPLRAAKIWP